METGINLTGYDFIVLGLLILFIARGVWLGLLRQVTGLFALFVAYFVAGNYHDRIFPFLKGISDNPKVAFIAGCVILFVITYIVVMLLGKALVKVVEITIAKWFDKLLGALLGIVLGVFVVILVHMMMGSLLPAENTMLKDCQTCTILNPATDYARDFIQDEEVRKALMQQTQAITKEDVIEFFERNTEAVGDAVDKVL